MLSPDRVILAVVCPSEATSTAVLLLPLSAVATGTLVEQDVADKRTPIRIVRLFFVLLSFFLISFT
jgi:hypothetical protein